MRTRFWPTPKIKYNTHSWEDIEENKTLISMGIQKQRNIVKCSKCEMYGGISYDFFNKTDAFHIGEAMNDKYYHSTKNNYEYSCDETVIKKILE